MKYSPLQNDRESLNLNKGRSKTNFFDEVGTVECHILVWSRIKHTRISK